MSLVKSYLLQLALAQQRRKELYLVPTVHIHPNGSFVEVRRGEGEEEEAGRLSLERGRSAADRNPCFFMYVPVVGEEEPASSVRCHNKVFHCRSCGTVEFERDVRGSNTYRYLQVHTRICEGAN